VADVNTKIKMLTPDLREGQLRLASQENPTHLTAALSHPALVVDHATRDRAERLQSLTDSVRGGPGGPASATDEFGFDGREEQLGVECLGDEVGAQVVRGGSVNDSTGNRVPLIAGLAVGGLCGSGSPRLSGMRGPDVVPHTWGHRRSRKPWIRAISPTLCWLR
jgi:hypothetical protein